MWSLFIGDLSARVRQHDLENTFRRFGKSKIVLKDGFAFAMYEEHRDAERALVTLQGKSICGERASLSWAKTRRPFQRSLDKGNYVRRRSWDKYDIQPTRKRSSDRTSEDERRGNKLLDKTKDDLGTGDDGVQTIENEEEGKDPQLAFDNEAKEVDPLDTGRWDPHTEGSLDHLMGAENRENEGHMSDAREDDKGSVHKRSKGPTEDKHWRQSSRGHRSSHGMHKRGRELAPGKRQERFYNHGESENVKRQRMNGMHRRESYDVGRNDMRHFRGAGRLRGVGGSRFRGMDGSRRIFNRGMEGRYGRNNTRRHTAAGDRKHHNQVDTGYQEKNRHAYHRSKYPKDSSRDKSNRQHHKSSSKKSLQSPRKRRKLSSISKSRSGSPKASSTSSESESSSKSHSKSGSGSSTTESHTSSSRSQSQHSLSKSSSSHLQSSTSPSRVSSHSQKADKGSKSLTSESHLVSHSSYSHPSQTLSSSKLQESDYSPSRSPEQRSAYKYEDDEEFATSRKRESRSPGLEDKQMYANGDKKHSSDSGGEYEHGIQSACGQNNSPKSIKSSVPLYEKSSMNDEVYKNANHSIKVSDHHHHIHENQAPESMKCTVYMAVMKDVYRNDGRSEFGIENHGAARFWPWESILYKRLKRGPISTENYERRKAQNEEFGIKDRFIRSSSGWWEKALE